MTEENRPRRIEWWEYLPLGLWLGLTIASPGTVLTVKAIMDIRSGTATFLSWFGTISTCGTLQLLFELGLSWWMEKHFLDPDQRKAFYRNMSLSGSAVERWIEHEFHKLYHARISGAGYLKLFSLGLCPRIPKLPLAFICWGKQAWGAFALLAVGNVLRVALELKLGLEAVETLGVSGALFVITVVFAWMFFRKKARRN